jgi:tRNA-2-methylthio-N6-dimethylallyladenosine synthase
VKNGLLTTDIIVGFPGETRDDFQATYDLVKAVGFDAAYIFKYSPRPHTAALQLEDDVPVKEKERRHAMILDLQKSISKAKKKDCLFE